MSTTWIIILVVALYIVPMVLLYIMMYREYGEGGELEGYRKNMIDYVGPTVPIVNIMVLIQSLIDEPVRKKPEYRPPPPPRRGVHQPIVDNTTTPPRAGINLNLE